MLLFVNACLRAHSRTERLARLWLERYEGTVDEFPLREIDVEYLDAMRLATYQKSVAALDYEHPMFWYAKDFVRYDEILIAAPFWNYGVPAILHAYLELVCSQGVSFDVGPAGEYVSLAKAQRLVYVQTAGGAQVEPQDDHAFGYVRTLAERFWHIPQVEQVAAWGLDAPGADVDALLAAALEG